MSKKKLYQIDREALKEATKANGVTLSKLAEELERDYNTFHKYITTKGISKLELDYIARRLDRAPEYLTGETANNPLTAGTVFTYVLHERQNLDRNNVLRDFINCYGLLYGARTYRQYTPQERGQIQKALTDALELIALRIEKQRSEAERQGKEEQK